MCRWMGSHFHEWIDYSGVASLRSMAVLSSRAQERRSREIRVRSARERLAKQRDTE